MEYRREESGERVGGSGEGVEKEWRRSERRCSGSCGSNAKLYFHRDMSGTSLQLSDLFSSSLQHWVLAL